jgi:DNA-binding transcriptional MerR regulator
MRIGELGQAMGVDVETIRYYEKAGLLASPRAHRQRLPCLQPDPR